MGPPSQILPSLWLGNFESAQDKNLLKKLKVTRILTVGNRSPAPDNDVIEGGQKNDDDGEGLRYKFVFAFDNDVQNLLKHFRDCFDFIRAALDDGRGVLVHCHMGFSRSATVVIGYLMHAERLSYTEAFDRVRKKRIVGPNSGFVRQLRLFERMKWNLDADYRDDDFVFEKEGIEGNERLDI